MDEKYLFVQCDVRDAIEKMLAVAKGIGLGLDDVAQDIGDILYDLGIDLKEVD